MNNKDKILLERIQAIFKGGNIYYKSSNKRVTNQLFNIIIPPLYTYPFLSYFLFKNELIFYKKNNHLNI